MFTSTDELIQERTTLCYTVINRVLLSRDCIHNRLFHRRKHEAVSIVAANCVLLKQPDINKHINIEEESAMI